jgi:tetratricopeptide (TPR) repeat protein
MFLRGLAVHPSDVDTQKNVAISASALEQAALQRWKSAGSPVEKTPQLARPLYQLGYAYYRLKDAAKSLAAYQQATDICPTWADAWNDRANVLNELGRRDEAKALYLQAIEVDPKFSPAFQNVIRVLEAEGNLQEAARFRVRAPIDGAQGERSGM